MVEECCGFCLGLRKVGNNDSDIVEMMKNCDFCKQTMAGIIIDHDCAIIYPHRLSFCSYACWVKALNKNIVTPHVLNSVNKKECFVCERALLVSNEVDIDGVYVTNERLLCSKPCYEKYVQSRIL